MYIKTLSLVDLRSFENATIELSKNINILTGHNNSGKSSIIKALYKIQNTNSIIGEDIRKKRDFLEILIELTGVTNQDRARYFNEKHPLSDGLDDLKIYFKISKVDHISKFQQRETDPSLKQFNSEGFEITGYKFKDFSGFPASEDQNNFIYPFFAKRKSNHYETQGTGVNTYSVFENFQNLPAKVNKTASQFVTRKKYEAICSDILGFEVTSISGEHNNFKLGFYSGYNDYIPLESMGEGVANIIGLITILLTENNRLFLIEELENDIHPIALKKLLNLVIEKSESNQFVISTHSNIVLKYLGSQPSTKIFYTEYDPIGNSEVNIPTSTIKEIHNTPEERLRILEHLGYDLFDYDLYKGYIIFEESSAERIVRDFVIPLFFPEVLFKIRTIAAQGAGDLEPKFNDLHRLFLYLHKSEIYKDKAWVIADGDETGKASILKIKEKFKSWDVSHFLTFSKSNFEEYYPEHFQSQIDEVLNMPKSDLKRQKKSELLNSVIAWMRDNPYDTQTYLEERAKEVVEKVGLIVKSLNVNKY